MITPKEIEEAKSWTAYQMRFANCIGAYFRINDEKNRIECRAIMMSGEDKQFDIYGVNAQCPNL